MTADAVSSAAKLSPRKQRESKPLADTFFGAKGTTAKTPSASASTAPALPSSSPAFATPLHPIRPFVPNATTTNNGGSSTTAARPAAILPILLPPATLRPLAFRTFTKKHSLTLTASALQALAAFVGRHCGAGWREEGLAERVLEAAAKSWKDRNCGFIVDGAAPELKEILKTLEGNMRGGRIVAGGGGSGGLPAAAGSAGEISNSNRRIGSAGAGASRGISRQDSLLLDATRETDITNTRLGLRPALDGPGTMGKPLLAREDSQASLGLSGLDVEDAEEGDGEDDDGLSDPRQWLKVVSAYDQPRMLYNVTKKHFERDTSKPSLLPSTAHKTTAFRNRFNVIHQRLLRNEAFQSSAVAEARAVATLSRSSSSGLQQTHRITPVANLLGRHGTHHMLLGMLVVLPTGSLSLCDLTASIALDLSSAVAVPADSAWFAPGMIVLVDGVYEEEEESAGRGLNGATGVGGTIGGRFQAFFVGQPPSETRRAALGISGPDGSGADSHTIGGGFGWIDFLGVGSHRAVGQRMRRLEQRFWARQQRQRRQHRRLQQQQIEASEGAEGDDADIGAAAEARPSTAEREDDPSDPPPPTRQRVVVLGELQLDQPRTLQALRRVLGLYAAEPEGATPVAFVLTGNFTEHAVMAASSSGGSGGGSGGSIEYKEVFDALAAALSDHPALLQASTFVFVPGDNDGWVSAFGGGAAVPLPRKPVPDLFTSRVRRAFAAANAEVANSGGGGGGASGRLAGEAVWTTNPSRLSLFGPNHEIVLFRDDISARLRRTAVRLGGANGDSGGDGGGGAAAAAAVAPPAEEEGTSDQMDVDVDADVDPDASDKAAASSGNTTETAKELVSSSTAVSHDVRAARKLVKTLLDQGHLAPFKQSVRPVHWDYASALHLYPLPTALVLVDTTAPPFCVTYEGCHVMNPGPLLVAGRRGAARWVEYEVGRVGRLRECTF